jgi:hypothetical protein
VADEKPAERADREYTMMTFAQSMGLQWGKADLLAIGPDAGFKRVAELAAIFSIYGEPGGSGARKAGAVWIVLPPVANGGAGAALAALREGFEAALDEVSAGKATEAMKSEAFNFISPRILPSFDGDELIKLVASAPPRAAVIVAEAGQYRSAKTKFRDSSQLDDTIRAAHLHQLLVEIDVISQSAGSYIVLDSGFHAPLRKADIDLLQSVGDTGFVAGTISDIDPEQTLANISRWIDAVKAGEIGNVIQEIEADLSLSDRQRFFMKLEAYSSGGLHDLVRAWLAENPDMLIDIPVDQAIHIARISETADDDDFAESLITKVLPDIRSERDFENALSTTLEMRNKGLREAVAAAFRQLHPNSGALKRFSIVEAARAGRYGEAAELLSSADHPQAAVEAVYYGLLATATANVGWDPHEALIAIVKALPDFAEDGALEIARALERSDRRNEGFLFLLARGDQISGPEVVLLLRLASTSLQAGEMAPSHPLIVQILDRSLAYLANHPGNGTVRARLAMLMGPTLTAGEGLGMLVVATLQRAQALPHIRSRPKVNDRPRPVSPEEAQPRLEHIWKWLAAEGKGMWLVGQHSLPAAELDLPAEQLLAAIIVHVDYAGDRLADDGDLAVLKLYLAAASAIAPLSPEPDEDLTVLRTVGSKLAIAGKGQMARDLAEFAVTIAGERPERHRQALFTFADIYARLGMKTEALVAFAAALETSAPATWDQIWFETNLLFRLLRDTGLADLGIPFLNRSLQALEALGLAKRDGYRIETLKLQATVAAFANEQGSDEDLAELLVAAITNAEAVFERSDDLLPIAMILNTLVDLAKARNIEITAPAEAMIDRILAALPAPQQQMIRAAGWSPSLADIAGVARGIDEPRYADDAGYDLRLLRSMTRKLVGGALEAVDPKTLIYAVEASADRAISVKATDGTKVAVERLLTRESGPIEAAEKLSGFGAAIVGMAMFDQQLATIEFEAGQVSDLTLEPLATFSLGALTKWGERFPKDYSKEDKDLSRDQVRGSVIDLGVTKLPQRSLVVADAQLHRFPPNLLTIDGNFAGFDRAIGVTPSLEWLLASQALNRQGDGSCRMWIPVSEHGDAALPLTLMADEVEPTLASHGVALERGANPSAAFRETDVTIIGAHGGLAEVNRYFRSLSNDEHVVSDISDIAEATRRARLTILFVCSGGRIDAHPETGMAVSLAKRILARGSAAVIAPAWPIPFFMAQPWLDGFLGAWRNGMIVLDACHEANKRVATTSSYDPKRSLAMSLYGDPFVRAF